MSQKRYWLFIIPDRDADGGMYDFHDSFDTIESAKKEYEDMHSKSDEYPYHIEYPLKNSIAQIYDSLQHIQVSACRYHDGFFAPKKGYLWNDELKPIRSFLKKK